MKWEEQYVMMIKLFSALGENVQNQNKTYVHHAGTFVHTFFNMGDNLSKHFVFVQYIIVKRRSYFFIASIFNFRGVTSFI